MIAVQTNHYDPVGDPRQPEGLCTSSPTSKGPGSECASHMTAIPLASLPCLLDVTYHVGRDENIGRNTPMARSETRI
jgi:hypothetical protein